MNFLRRMKRPKDRPYGRPPPTMEGAKSSNLPPALEMADNPLNQAVLAALRQVYDPEIPVNIVDLGLIYALSADPARRHVDIRMTLTAPGCPVAASFPDTVAAMARTVEGIDEAEVTLVFDPPWARERMTAAARLELGMTGDPHG